MDNGNFKKSLYIVISQTGTIPSRLLKFITRKEYNHVSLSLSEDLKSMYSFGRKRPYNPFFGGFVVESANTGTFKRFPDAKIRVLRLEITDEEYDDISRNIDDMLSVQKKYHYNYFGLCLAAFNINRRFKNRYYCSEFVKDILVKSDVEEASGLDEIVHPMNFLDMPNVNEIYSGSLMGYSPVDTLHVS